eukprot:g69113.t1
MIQEEPRMEIMNRIQEDPEGAKDGTFTANNEESARRISSSSCYTITAVNGLNFAFWCPRFPSLSESTDSDFGGMLYGYTLVHGRCEPVRAFGTGGQLLGLCSCWAKIATV